MRLGRWQAYTLAPLVVLLLGAAPAEPDLSRPWIATTPGGHGALVPPKTPSPRWTFTRRGQELHVEVQLRPASRWYQSETLEGRLTGKSCTLAGVSSHPGPDDGPVKERVYYELTWNGATGRFEGTRREGKLQAFPFALAPVGR